MATLGHLGRNHCIVATLGGWSCHDGVACSGAGGRWSIDLDGQDQIRCWRTDGHMRNQIHPRRHGHRGSTQAGSQCRGNDANRRCSWGILDTVHPGTVYPGSLQDHGDGRRQRCNYCGDEGRRRGRWLQTGCQQG